MSYLAHRACGGYGCLHVPDTTIPPVTDEPGKRHVCACGASWVIRETAGFVVWQPDEPTAAHQDAAE